MSAAIATKRRSYASIIALGRRTLMVGCRNFDPFEKGR